MQGIDSRQISFDFRAATGAPEVGQGFDARKNFLLFVWWAARFCYPPPVIALILGVDVRTVNRWRRLRRVPRSIAMHIDPAVRGPIVQFSTWRGAVAWRWDWRNSTPANASVRAD